MRAIVSVLTIAASLLAAGQANAQGVGPFAGTASTIRSGQMRPPQLLPPPPPGVPAAAIPAPTPTFDVYTKEAISFDASTWSPSGVLGYKNVRSGAHPWTLEGGYKNADSGTGRVDVWLATGTVTAWSAGSDTKAVSISVEEDFSMTQGVQTRSDSYAIAEVVRGRVAIDVLAGLTAAATPTAPSNSDFLAGVLPSVELGKGFGLQGLYALKNDIDGEDYYEVGLGRTFQAIGLQLQLAVAKHKTYAIRFQKTLKHFYGSGAATR